MFYQIEGTLTALSPIFTGGDEKTGSTPILRTVMMYTENGEVPIPYISGNSIRGKLRRLLIRNFLSEIGYKLTNAKLHHVLHSGGILESTDENVGTIDLELRKKIRENIPPIALLGCSIGNQIIAGVLTVEHLWPICEEYCIYLPEEYQNDERAKKPVRIFTDQSFITRRDDLRERKEEEQAVQMKVDYEVFIPGTKFYHRFILLLPDELQKSTFARMLELFEMYPYIGGRSSQGDGKVMINYKNSFNSKLYKEFLEEKKNSILDFLTLLEEKI